MNPNNLLGRPLLDEYYMAIAFAVSMRAACLNRSIGAVITVSDGELSSIAGTGYNSPEIGASNCVTCRRREEGYKSGEGLHRSRSIHAEINGLLQCARYGRSINGGTIYVTDSPCSLCSRALVNAGIKKIVYCGEYPDSESEDILKNAGVETFKVNKENVLNRLKGQIEAFL